MKEKHIVAGSAGFLRLTPARPELGPVMRYMLDLTGQKRPKLCLLATADGDDPAWFISSSGSAAIRDTGIFERTAVLKTSSSPPRQIDGILASRAKSHNCQSGR